MVIKRTLVALSIASVTMFSAGCARSDRTYIDTASGTVITDNMRIDDVTLGKGLRADNKVAEAIDEFVPTDTIHASVKTVGMGTGAVLSVVWTYQDTVVIDTQTRTISANGDMYTDFLIARATPWAKGKYKVTVVLNGKETEAERFAVK